MKKKRCLFFSFFFFLIKQSFTFVAKKGKIKTPFLNLFVSRFKKAATTYQIFFRGQLVCLLMSLLSDSSV